MTLILVCSLWMKCADFQWNGNPIKWVEAKVLVDEGTQLRAHHKLEDAYRHFKQAANIYPNDSKFQFALGEVCQTQEKYPEAQTAFEEVRKLEPDNIDAQLHLSEVLSMQEKNDMAIRVAEKAVNSRPLNAEAQMQLALLLQLAGKKTEAARIVQSCREMERSTARYWYLAGRYFHELGQPQETEAAFRQATQMEPSNAEYADWLGMCLVAQSKINEAGDQFEKAAKINEERSSYLEQLARVRLRQNDLPGAEKALEKLVKLNPDNRKVAFIYAQCLGGQGKYSEAEPVLSSLVGPKTNKTVWNEYINVLLRQKKFPETEKAVRGYMDTTGNNQLPQTWVLLADVLRAEMQPDKAAVAYKQALALKPPDKLKRYVEKRLSEPQKSGSATKPEASKKDPSPSEKTISVREKP